MGGGIVEEVVTTPCNECGDLSAALEWTSWAPCADQTSDEWTDEWTSVEASGMVEWTGEETSGKVVEGMLCRRRGNAYIGYEEEGTCRTHLRNTRFYFSFVQSLFVRLLGHSSQQAATGD